jgi:hypothetical protein
VAKLPVGTLSIAEIRAYIDRDLLTIPSTNADIVQDDARAGTNSENEDQPQQATTAEVLVNLKSKIVMKLIPTARLNWSMRVTPSSPGSLPHYPMPS